MPQWGISVTVDNKNDTDEQLRSRAEQLRRAAEDIEGTLADRRHEMSEVKTTTETGDLGEFSNCDICGEPFEIEDGRAFGYCIDGFHFDDGGSIDMAAEEFHKGYICFECVDYAWAAAVEARHNLTKE